ncbi:MAG: hypothetical protein WA981_01890 [Glaciecola sp.]
MRIIVFCCSLILLFNSAFSSLASAVRFSDAASALNENALVICTGSTVKVISSFHYFELGEIVELSNEQHSGDVSDLTCPLNDCVEPSKLPNNVVGYELLSRVSFLKLRVYEFQNPYLFNAYSIPATRAPPVMA